MTLSTSSLPGAALAPSGTAAALKALLVAVRDHLRIRRAIRELRELSPALLKDMGIDRSEIERVARYGRRGL